MDLRETPAASSLPRFELLHGKDAMMQLSPTVRTRLTTAFLVAVVPVLCLIWAYWITFKDIRNAWNSNASYSHGYLVPLFALALLWFRRKECDFDKLAPNWWGLIPLVVGCCLRLYSAYFYRIWLDQLSIIPCIAGLAMTLGGWPAIRWSWQSIVFLVFMIPLPFSIATALSNELQTVATISSTFIMQTLGLPAVSEGNQILVNDARIGIVEACSGLRMLVVFIALSAGMVMVIKRPAVDKTVLVLSAIPIALLTNIIRVTVTGLLYQSSYAHFAETFFHDVAGWLMPPLALGFLWLEMKILDNLFIVNEGRAGASGTPARISPTRPSSPTVVSPIPALPAGASVPGMPRRTRYVRPGTQAAS